MLLVSTGAATKNDLCHWAGSFQTSRHRSSQGLGWRLGLLSRVLLAGARFARCGGSEAEEELRRAEA